MDTRNNVVAVVVTYNRKAMLRGCLENLLNLKKTQCDIILIDNASTDGTKAAVQDLIDDGSILYYNTGENIGGAGGFRVGAEKAVQLGYKYVWLMDDDTYVKPLSLYYLMEADRRLGGRYGFLSGVAYWIDGSVCNMNRQRIGLHKKMQDYTSDEVPIIMATFVSFFIKAEVILQFGLPIKEFFIWSDDLEYSRRISRKLPCYAVPASEVVHRMGSNQKVGIEHDAPDRLWRYRYMYRNEVFLYRREGLKGYLYLYARTAFHLLKVLFKAKEAKSEKLKVIRQSFKAGFHFHPQIEYVNLKERDERHD